MFYIKFNGYKKDKEECAGLFFVGNTYQCSVVDSNRNYQTQDEHGNVVKFDSIISNKYYDFSRLDGKCDAFVEHDGKCEAFGEHDNKMRYRMNGIDVTKSFFDEELIEVERLKSMGVLVHIDFEVGFE